MTSAEHTSPPVIDFGAYMAAAGSRDGVGDAPRRFLFLQGPHGPFFAKLAQRLKAEGHVVHRIHFNGGDKGDWMQNQGIAYMGTAEDWPQYLTDYAFRNNITDIVFYSYWRPVHQAAIQLARQANIRLHGFEEGLLRPFWVNIDPRLPCEQIADVRAAVTGSGPVVRPYADKPVQNDLRPQHASDWMYMQCIRYYLNIFRFRKSFPRHSTHRIVSPAFETTVWVRNFFAYPLRKLIAEMRLRKATQEKSPCFVLCLQLDGDSQIRKYSSFSGMREVLDIVMTSFAAHAPANARLVIKNHPLDNCIFNLEKYTRRLARDLGIAKRVTFINFGKLAALIKSARGMVVVNSTTGLQALQHGCPVKALGLAIYNIPGLADPQDLNSFWLCPQKPSAEVYEKLANVLLETSQHGGSFFDPACHAAILESCLPLLSDGAYNAAAARLMPQVQADAEAPARQRAAL